MSVPEKTKSILFLAVLCQRKPSGGYATGSGWFTLHPSVGSSVQQKFHDVPASFADFHPSPRRREESFLKGLSSAVVDNYLYAVGGCFDSSVVSQSMYRLNILDQTKVWEEFRLKFPCAHSPIGVYGDKLYILPSDGCRLENRIHIFDTKNRSWDIISGLPEGAIRGCAALEGEGEGFLVVVERNGECAFYVHRPGEKQFVACNDKEKLPQFRFCRGSIPFAVLKKALFILDPEDAMLYAFDIITGRKIFKQTINKLDGCLYGSPRMVAVSDHQLCVMWQGPIMYNAKFQETRRIMRCLKISFEFSKDPVLLEVDLLQFNGEIIGIVDCVPYDDPLKKDGMVTDSQSLSLPFYQMEDMVLYRRHKDDPTVGDFRSMDSDTEESDASSDDESASEASDPNLPQAEDIDSPAPKKRKSCISENAFDQLCNECQDIVTPFKHLSSLENKGEASSHAMEDV